MANIRLNKLEIEEVTLIKLDDVLSEATGKELQKYEGNCTLRGQSVYEEFDALSSNVDFEVIDTDISYRAHLKTEKVSYQPPVNETTLVEVTFTLTELDPALPEDHDREFASTYLKIDLHNRVRALTDLLIQKGIFTTEEYNEAYEKHRNDEEEVTRVVKYLLYGLSPNPAEADAKE